MKTDQEKIDYILDRFDFEKVKRVMDAVDWCWYTEGVPEMGVPKIWMMREGARNLLRHAIEFNGVCKAGGFEASYSKGEIELKFVVTCQEYLDSEEIDE